MTDNEIYAMAQHRSLQCIRTGADVLLTQYNELVHGDLFLMPDRVYVLHASSTHILPNTLAWDMMGAVRARALSARTCNLRLNAIAHWFDRERMEMGVNAYSTIIARVEDCSEFSYEGRNL